MFIDAKGIVLRCVKYDDKSFIAHVFTASHGHVSFMVNASRSKRSGASVRLFQPFSFLAFQWDAKPNVTLHRMKEVRLLFVQHEIPTDPVKRYVVMMLAEFMVYALGGEAENSDLYVYMEHSVQWFDAAQEGYANFHLVLLLKLARFLGIAPNVDEYVKGCAFDLTNGHFVPTGIASELMMDMRDAELLCRLSETNYASMAEIAMNRHDRARLVRYLARYFSLHIPGFPAIKSLDILQEVMG